MVDREQIALAAQSEAERRLDPVSSLPRSSRAGVDVATTEKVLFEEIEKVRTTEIPAEELRKAKNQLLTNFYREMKTDLRPGESVGNGRDFPRGYEKMYETPGRYEAVTAADVLRVAKKYLGPNQRTIATLIPEVAKRGAWRHLTYLRAPGLASAAAAVHPADPAERRRTGRDATQGRPFDYVQGDVQRWRGSGAADWQGWPK